MTAWEALAIAPVLFVSCIAIVLLFFGATILLESPRIIPALRHNWREEIKLHFWRTTIDLLVSTDN